MPPPPSARDVRAKGGTRQLLYSNELEVVFARHHLQFGAPGHGSVFVQDFTDDANRGQSGQASQINRRFGLAYAPQHTSLARTEGKDMPGPAQVVWDRRRIGKHFHPSWRGRERRCRS